MIEYHKVIFLRIEYILIYLVAICYISVFLCAYDKHQAKLYKHRISEKILFLFAAMGGALPMYIVMKCIHHKTRKKRFMIGLPVIFVLHILALVYFVFIR